MPEPLVSDDITQLLGRWAGGDVSARDRLIPLVYRQLRAIAARRLRGERLSHTLGPTALVHEAFLRLSRPADRLDRVQFFGICANLMREILVDHARRRRAMKRGGGWRRTDPDLLLTVADEPDWDLLTLDEILRELSTLSARQGRVVELRFFGGMSADETAECLGISVATVRRDWQTARAWLYRRLEQRRRSCEPVP